MILKATQIYKSYGNKWNRQEVLKGLDIEVEKSEFVSIMGASGSGKTTLLNVLSSIDRPTQGTITIEGKELTRMKGKGTESISKESLRVHFPRISFT